MIMLPTMSRRHQIRRELDARIFQMQHARKRAQKGGLPESRNAFEQHMAAGEQADQNAVDHILLADDNLADFLTDPVELRGGELEMRYRAALDYSSASATSSRPASYPVQLKSAKPPPTYNQRSNINEA